MRIDIIGPDFDGYAVTVEGDTVMECMSESDVRSLTIGELIKYWEDSKHA